MAFNHFFRFLLEHEPKRRSVLSPTVIGGAIVAVIGITSFTVSCWLAMFLLLISILLFTGPDTVDRWSANKKFESMPPELRDIWNEIRWMAVRRELNRRFHPKLRSLLEEIAEIRRITLDALNSEAWKARARTPGGAQAIKDIEAVLQDSLYNAIFIGRYLFRRKGQREATFARRCADPEFGKTSLESIAQIRDEMRLLSESALAAGERSDLRVNLVRERLQAVVDAEREVEEISSFDPTE